jgi:8-oxo-dGTP diphosphatase
MKQVTAAILIQKGKCLIAKRSSTDTLANLWEFPGGKIETGETPEECLQREMEEELSIRVDVGPFFADSVYHYAGGTIRLMAYLVYWQGSNLELRVHDSIAWVDSTNIDDYNFAPADVPIKKRLKEWLA